MLASLFTLALVPLALAGPVVRRTADDIVTGVNKVGSDLVALNNTLNTFKPNNPASTIIAFQIQSETKTIENDLNALINTTKATGNLDGLESGNVATAVVNLDPQIMSVLNNIVQHKPAFATAIFGFGDLSKTVEQALKTQKSLANTFGTTLTPKLASPYRDFAPQIIAEINGYFDTAIKAYQQCTGKVCFPPIPSQ